MKSHCELFEREQCEGQRHTEHHIEYGEGTGLMRGLRSHPLGVFC